MIVDPVQIVYVGDLFAKANFSSTSCPSCNLSWLCTGYLYNNVVL